jgi:hypothetical protein
VYAGARSALSGAAGRLFETGLTLPSGSSLDESAIGRILDAVRAFLDGHR